MRPRSVILAATLLAGVTATAQQSEPAGDFVEIDVLVLDRHDRPVHGLGVQDFQVREDGRPVEVKTFSAPGATGEHDDPGAQLVLLLDDSSVPMFGTQVIQGMANAVVARKGPRDEVTVVRLNNDRDEPYGDLETALTRIGAYRGGAVPFQNIGTADRVLKVVTSIARQLDAVGRQRREIVCLGGPRVCNVLEPLRNSLLWRPWVEAVSVTSRANVAVYAVMPVPIGTPMRLAGGLAEVTGGDGFANASSFDRFVDRLWLEARDYYLLGYWPTGAARELHSIDVKVNRRDLHVRVRRQRG